MLRAGKTTKLDAQILASRLANDYNSRRFERPQGIPAGRPFIAFRGVIGDTATPARITGRGDLIQCVVDHLAYVAGGRR